MKNKDQKTNSMTHIAQAQAIGGKLLSIGKGFAPIKSEQVPCRTLNGSPVYYSGHNEYDLAEITFIRSKTSTWGEFYHPYLMFGSPPIGGMNKVYVDTRISGWYLLWVVSRLDPWDVGPNDWLPSIVTWTPRGKNDSVKLAGYRLFWAAALGMDCVESDDFYNTDYDKDGKWKDEWACSSTCFQVFASIRKTLYKDEQEFDRVFSEAPQFLTPHLIARKLIL